MTFENPVFDNIKKGCFLGLSDIETVIVGIRLWKRAFLAFMEGIVFRGRIILRPLKTSAPSDFGNFVSFYNIQIDFFNLMHR